MLFILFVAVLIKLILPASIGWTCAWCINFITSFLVETCRFTASWNGVVYVGYVSFAIIIIYYVALFVGVTASRTRRFVVTSALILVLVGCLTYQAHDRYDAIVVYGGGSGQPALVVVDSVSNSADIINCPSRNIARRISQELAARGVNSVGRLIIAGSVLSFYGGTESLSFWNHIEEIYAPVRNMRTKRSVRMIERLGQNGVDVHDIAPYTLDGLTRGPLLQTTDLGYIVTIGVAVMKVESLPGGSLKTTAVVDGIIFEFDVEGSSFVWSEQI